MCAVINISDTYNSNIFYYRIQLQDFCNTNLAVAEGWGDFILLIIAITNLIN
jgi:hypothetical protein